MNTEDTNSNNNTSTENGSDRAEPLGDGARIEPHYQNDGNYPSRRFIDRKSFPDHIKEVQSDNGKLQFHCTVCSKTFNSRTQKYYHMSCGSTTDKRYKCEQCKKSFSSRSHLKYHLDSHSSSFYDCEICNKSFKNRAVLLKHVKQHKTEPLNCTECSQTFQHTSTLKAHIEKHRNNLRFVCRHCDRHFATNSTLHQHMKTHDETRKHSCSDCGKRFRRNSSLKLHMKKHNPTAFIHRCNVCNKCFSDPGTLLRHIKGHNLDVKYKCTHCDMGTLRRDNMMRHIRNMHVDEVFDDCVEIIKLKPTSTSGAASDGATSTPQTGPEQTVSLEPKTVIKCSVIKCIGNVKPIKVPTSSTEINEITVNTAVNFNENVVSPGNEKQKKQSFTKLPKEKSKKTYDPIEMYRKILYDDDDIVGGNKEESETSNLSPEEIASNSKQSTQHEATHLQQRSTFNTSKFSEMHWRKNFKYTYEYQDN